MRFLDFSSPFLYITLLGCCALAFTIAFVNWRFSENKSLLRTWNFSFTALAILCFLYTVYRMCWNVPFWDDFDAFLANYFFHPFPERLKLLPSLHNEHRIIVPRLVGELVYWFRGEVDFRMMMFFGNAGLLCYVGILIFQAKKQSLSTLWYVLISWMVVSLFMYENTFWALTSIQSNYILLFGLLAVILTDRSQWGLFLLGLLCAGIAMVSNGSGVAIWPILILQEIKKRFLDKSSSTNLRLLIVSLVSILCLFLYFMNYQTPPLPPEADTSFHWWTPFRMIAYFCAFCGASAYFLCPSFLFGLIMCFAFTAILFNFRRIKNSPLFFYWLLLLGSAAIAALFRSGFGLEQALAFRYRIVSVSILIVTLILLSDLFPRMRRFFDKILPLVVFCVVASHLTAYIYFAPIFEKEILSERRNAILNYKTQPGLLKEVYPDAVRAEKILRRAEEIGVYQIGK